VQSSFASLDNPGIPEIIGLLPPSHKPAGAGMQGWGVSTPRAAAVAAATVGFVTVVHIPQGVTDAIGVTSRIVAAGMPAMSVVSWDVTFNVPGAVPKTHMQVAPETTAIPIIASFHFFSLFRPDRLPFGGGPVSRAVSGALKSTRLKYSSSPAFSRTIQRHSAVVSRTRSR
jgi:hypothetical protein